MKAFLDLLSADDAYERIGTFAPLGTEKIPTRTSLGRIIAEHVTSEDDIPHFLRSNMDGFAVRAEDTSPAETGGSVVLDLIGAVAMGKAATVNVGPGQAARISTGAMMPDGADAVVIVEKTESAGSEKIAVAEAVVRGQNLVRIGEDMRKGDPVYAPGRRIAAPDVGVLTGVGLSEVLAYRVPRVGIMATGDEIVEPEEELGPGQVRNVNQYLLAASANKLGAVVNDYGVVGDDSERLSSTLSRAVKENDAVFISGGSSKGTKDLTLSAIRSLPESDVVFHGIAIAPGKPTILAKSGSTAIMGLPGNPAAAAVVFALFGSVLVRVIGGEDLRHILRTRPRVRARVSRDVRSNLGREDYLRVRLVDGDDDLPVAEIIPGKSVAISTLAHADGILRVPLQTEGLESGSQADVFLF